MTNGLIDGKAFCEVESYWIKSFAGRFQTSVRPELLKGHFLSSTVFPKHDARGHGKRKQTGPKDDTKPVPTDSALSNGCPVLMGCSDEHSPPVFIMRFRISGSFGCC